MIKKISTICNKYFALLVIIIAIIALMRPNTFLWVVPRVSLLLGIIMFGMGMTLKKEDFKEVFTRPKDVLVGIIAHYIIMPAVAYALCVFLKLPKDIAIGVILVGCCPSGTASNVMCFIAKGDLALSVCISSISTILAPIFTPALILLLAGKWVDIPAAALFVDISKIVILPIVLGVVFNKVAGKTASRVVNVLPIVSVIAIVLIVGGVVGANSKKLITTAAIAIGAVVLHNLFGFLFGYLVAKAMKMDYAKRKAVSFEVGMQNSALGVSLAMNFFSPVSAIPAAIFSVWHNISGPTLASYWASKFKKVDK